MRNQKSKIFNDGLLSYRKSHVFRKKILIFMKQIEAEI